MESARVVLWGGGESFSDHRHHRDLQQQPQHPERPRWSLPDDDDEDCLSSFAQDEDHRQQWGTAPYHKRPRHRAGWAHDDDGDDADDDEDDRTIDDDDEGAALPEDYPYGWTPGDAPPAALKEKRRRPGSDAADLDSIPQTSSSSGAPDSPSLTSRGRSSSGTGSLFFKTKLCIKFRAGTCPYNSNCNFAHGMEELRNPPPGWEEIVAVQDAERGPRSNNSSKDLSSQYILSSSGPGNMPDSQRFRRTRRCKKYYSDEGCPYGDRCNFLHDDQARARESNAISLGPTSGPVNGGGGNSGNGGERPSNWKTRMCNKWEMTGHCPFGQKCNFAHGFTELQMYGGAHGEAETGASAGTSATTDTKTARVSSKSFSEVGSLYAPSVYATDGHNVTSVKYRAGFLLSVKSQKQASRPLSNWKGPVDEVSTIYGDWIEEDE